MDVTSRANRKFSLTVTDDELETIRVALALSGSFHADLARKSGEGTVAHTLALRSLRRLEPMVTQLRAIDLP